MLKPNLNRPRRPGGADTPRYKQVKQAIMQCLKTGKWKDGQLIPTESRLAEQFKVSIGTVRKAVGELVSQKMLMRIQGSGTYVVSQTQDHMLDLFFHVVRRDGNKQFPAHELVTFKKIPVDALSARHLNMSRDDKVFYIESVASLHGHPVIFDKIVLPCRLFPDLTEVIFRNRGKTTFGLYQSRYGINVVRADEMVIVAAADKSVARFLGMAADAHFLEIQRTAYSYDNLPVEFRRRLVNTARHGYFNSYGVRQE
jgi:GntR family transcriptional regulator